MYKRINYIAAILVLVCGLSAQAQVTTSSPYSRFGVGNIKGSLLPQLRAMGGISTAVNKVTGFNYINMQNPASYSGITLTTIDIGMSAGYTSLARTGLASETSFNATFSHLAFAVPVSRRSALSFGILPYSDLGYSYRNKVKIDTLSVDQLYEGEGGLSKAYIGYGYRIGDHFRIGGNVEYIFGNLQTTRSTEYNQVGALNAKLQNKNSVGGLNYSYGLQYDFNLGKKTILTLGYSGSSSGKVGSNQTFYATQYTRDASGNESAALDTLNSVDNGKSNLTLPLSHNFGISIQQNDKWLIGADFRMSKWSTTSINGVNQGLQDSWGASLGGQYTPDFTSYNNYLKRVDYRLGVNYNKTYIQIGNQDIKQMGVSLGFGLPLPAANANSVFYKINITAEAGQRGTLTNNLVKEQYLNFHLGFTLNDTWFRRYRVD
ncbi:outer membrane protein transport protein [Pedobacter mucosus]|uniref:outer membrane protein transport protein n=1 Tax=Pedobacter mucosus TaxID=2895286 RepID=UPI001EE46615|nr:outer membrane protein transport protein [Pedobacter mucosus]UKT63294.1 outer membrane protein transport protein [Pedobacter mucosus]